VGQARSPNIVVGFEGGLRLVRGLLGCVCGCSEVEGSDDEM